MPTYDELRALADAVERDVYVDGDGRIVGRPTTLGQRRGFPGTDRLKTDDEQVRDLRQAAFLERLGKLSTPQQLMRAGAVELGSRLGDYNMNKDGFRDSLNSDFEYVGFLGPGSALHTAGTWMSSLPSAAYATAELAGQNLGDMVERTLSPAGTSFAAPRSSWRNKSPERDLERAVNTFAAPLTSAVIPDEDFQPDESYWAMQRAARSQASADDWKSLEPMALRDAYRADELQKMPLQGDQYYERWGAPRPLAMAAGLVSDTMLDPFSAALPAARMARSARSLPPAAAAARLRAAGKTLASDYTLGGALTGYGVLDELLRQDR
jgi:hypothetical protein